MRYRELLEEVYRGQDSTRQGMAEAADLEAKLNGELIMSCAIDA